MANFPFSRRQSCAFVITFCLATAAAVRTADGNDGPIDIAALERQILDARRAIRSGEFIIDVTSTGSAGDVGSTYHIWFSPGGRIRQEHQKGDDKQVVVVDGEYAYRYDLRPGMMENPDRTKRWTIRRMPAAEAESLQSPQRIMCFPVRFDLLPYHGLEEALDGPGRASLRSQPSTWNGRLAVTVSFVTPRNGISYEYDVVPSLGHSIVRWRIHGVNRGGPDGPLEFDDSLTCELTEVSESFWFPAVVRFRSTWNGRRHVEEVLKIQSVSVNLPIDSKVFSLSGGSLPPDILVLSASGQDPAESDGTTRPVRPFVPERLLWDGRQVRPVTRRDDVAIQLSRYPAAGTSGINGMRYRLWAASVLALGGFAWLGYVLLKARQKRRGATSPPESTRL